MKQTSLASGAINAAQAAPKNELSEGDAQTDLKAENERLRTENERLHAELERFRAQSAASHRAMVDTAALSEQLGQLQAQLQQAQASTTAAAIPERFAGPPPPELAPLRELIDRVLQPLCEQHQRSSSSSTQDHATKLPAGLKDFTPLSTEPEIKEAAVGPHAL